MVDCKKLYALTVMLLVTVSAFAADRVRLVEGKSINGEITSVTRDGVTIEGIGRTEQVPITRLSFVLFESEPPQLTQARINLKNNGYETALEKLANADGGTELMEQDIDFYLAFCKTRLAIETGKGAREAGSLMTTFLRDHPQSFHYYAAVESLGDLLVSMKRFDRAEAMYKRVAEAPFDALKARARLRIGESLQAQAKPTEALQEFDAVLSASGTGEAFAALQLRARLAKAESLTATGDLEAGLRMAREVVQQSSDDQVVTLAAAYNTIGKCYEIADLQRDALYAYLHTDLLFNSDPATHAEALARLAELWSVAGKPQAAREARLRLQRQYAASRFGRAAG